MITSSDVERIQSLLPDSVKEASLIYQVAKGLTDELSPTFGKKIDTLEKNISKYIRKATNDAHISVSGKPDNWWVEMKWVF